LPCKTNPPVTYWRECRWQWCVCTHALSAWARGKRKFVLGLTVAQLLQRLPSKCKAQSSDFSTTPPPQKNCAGASVVSFIVCFGAGNRRCWGLNDTIWAMHACSPNALVLIANLSPFLHVKRWFGFFGRGCLFLFVCYV
jgi:hypothetical protein